VELDGRLPSTAGRTDETTKTVSTINIDISKKHFTCILGPELIVTRFFAFKSYSKKSNGCYQRRV
jgi:hypothetical protein